jgi:peptidoglycan/LPS O-acetylase OafA/YrhL
MLGHAQIPYFQGGFVGVDIFFVISGFLITAIIREDLAAGRFSLVEFYERRARRILPALYLVMICCLPAAWVLMSANALENFGQSLVATTLFANNVLLNLTSGYWDLESSFKPLLHTWSLGVEEQYYTVIPLLLLVAHKWFRQRVGWMLLLVGIVSFTCAAWATDHTPSFAFYELPSRGWELTVGGLVGLNVRRSEAPNSDLWSATGLLLIVVTIVALPEGSPAPIWAAVPPVAGTALILRYCRQGRCQRLLASAPFVGIGLISYSAYLWHQPLFAFARIASLSEPSRGVFTALIATSLCLAYLSWRFVEQPFRDRRRLSGAALVVILVPIAFFLIGTGLIIDRRGGFPARFPMAPGEAAPGTFKAYNMRVFASKRDVFLPSTTKRMLVIGNSTARDFINMAVENRAFPDFDIVYQDKLSICPGQREISNEQRRLIAAATVIVVVYAGRSRQDCTGNDIAKDPHVGSKVVFVGPKDFGVNMNPLLHLPLTERPAARVAMTSGTLDANRDFRAHFPSCRSVDMVRHLSEDGRTVPIFDSSGRVLSEDRVHVTRAGAMFVGARIFTDPVWNWVRESGPSQKHVARPFSCVASQPVR